MDEHWMRSLFGALTSKRLSRNKNFASFSTGWSRIVHRRFRIVRALKNEAERLEHIPGTHCWISKNGDGLLFHLYSPQLRYKREVALYGYEWDWLAQQRGVRALLSVKSLDTGPPAGESAPG